MKPHKQAPLWDAIIGRSAAELVTPYPPGIPRLRPGELITEEAVRYLEEVAQRTCSSRRPAILR